MNDNDDPVDRLTRELVGIGGPLASIASHMLESAQRQGSDPTDIPEILSGLLRPALEDLTEGWTPERIRDAADVLHAACERVCSEILLVPPPNRAQRRRARRR